MCRVCSLASCQATGVACGGIEKKKTSWRQRSEKKLG